VTIEASKLRHGTVLKGFLGPEVFEGTVAVARRPARAAEQLRL
jgi:hypothetical protein